MKTIYLISFLLTCFLSFASAQNLTDDIYFTPADAKKETPKVKVRADKPRYKNGAKEIIFKDSSQGKTVVLDQDTVFFLSEMNDSIAMEETTNTDQEEGYYLDGFEGGEMEYEYAERIRRFHNPKFSIHISDPQYMDIYFLDDSKWNVYIDGSYAWVTPTWTNPYWYNYYWAPYSYSSWYWRTNPYAYHSWYYSNPWTYGLYGWTGYSPWYYGYYDWGYPYYGGYYGHYYGGWGYPYYHYPYYWGSYTTVSRNKNYSEPARRRAISGGSSGASSVSTNTRISGGSYSPVVGRSTVVSNERSSRSTSTGTRPTELRSTVKSTSNAGTARSTAINTRISGVDTRTRTVTTSGNIDRGSNTIVPTVRQTQTRSTSGTVSSPTRSTRTVTTPTRSSTTVRAGTGGSSTLRSAVTTSSRSSSSSTSTYTPSVRSSSSSSTSNYSAPTRSSSSSGSSSYSAPSRSSSSSSSSSYSAPSRSSSSSSSGGSSRSSGGSGGGRR
ncbi:MAG: hypothetical protein BWY08_02156 [Bacteroidetes bacterium ADurb.Bin174]|nr:MAG: hypothetical protein BWY08_02156 [Bacteroidetes bacterium ADurb.Bin174]